MIEKEKSNHTWNIDIKATLHMCFERDPWKIIKFVTIINYRHLDNNSRGRIQR
jgi:hypothetical protein